jgi:hypothetical protein
MWDAFSEALRRRFTAVDEEYLDLVRALWDDGQLFENTRIGNDFIDGERVYFRTDRLQLTRDAVLAWD